MNAKSFAFVGGFIMLAMGVLALIPSLSSYPMEQLPHLKLQVSYGLFLGIFPLNILNKLALIAFGLTGIAINSANSERAAMTYSRVVFVVMGALALLGLFPPTNTLFGYWPLFHAEVVAHGIFALAGAYFGYGLRIFGQHGRPAFRV